jgi:hypothetical protein
MDCSKNPPPSPFFKGGSQKSFSLAAFIDSPYEGEGWGEVALHTNTIDSPDDPANEFTATTTPSRPTATPPHGQPA